MSSLHSLDVRRTPAEDAARWQRSALLAGVLGALLAGIAVVLSAVLNDAGNGHMVEFWPFALLALAGLAWHLYRADVEGLRRQRDELANEVNRLERDGAQLRTSLHQLQHELQRVERVDHLTGLANDRAFAEAIVDEWRRAARLKTPVALLLIDIDRVDAGPSGMDDEALWGCLRAVGSVLSASARRAGDLAARRERDRFAVLYSNCNAATATTLAKRIHASIASLHHALPVASAGGTVGKRELSVSIGVAAITPGMKDKADQLVADAEDALHAAAVAGGNRVDTNWQSPQSA